MNEEVNKDVAGLVPAAGSGTRLSLGPKAFLKLGERNLVTRVVNTLTGCVGRILVGVPPDRLAQCDELRSIAEVYPGGTSRQKTIYALLQRCTEDIILISDAVRPFVSRALIASVIKEARENGAATAYTHPTLPIAFVEKEWITQTVPHTKFVIPQSPQAYRRELLERAYEYALAKDIETQSTLELVLLLGVKALAVPGEETNIKITSSLDWEIARKIIAPLLEKDRKGRSNR